MKIEVVKGSVDYINDCEEALVNSELGKKLLQFFEKSCFKEFSKLFLVVANFNPDAKRLY